MSAEVESMMYAGATPWHGLGTYVGEEPVLSEEAIRLAGLDWEVGKHPIYTEVPEKLWDGRPSVIINPKKITVPDNYAIVREDNDRVLGVVGNQYNIVQNWEAMQLMDDLAGPDKLIRYHTAGSLFGGKKVWMLAELTHLTITPVPNDEVKTYLVLMTGHDGRTNLMVFFTGIRVVCWNTWQIALQGASRKGKFVKISHRPSAHDRMEEAKEILGLAQKRVVSHAEVLRALAMKSINGAKWNEFLNDLMPLPEPKDMDKPGRGYTIALNKREKLTELFESGVGTDIIGVRGTGWGAYNAVTEFTTHLNSVKVGVDKDNKAYARRKAERQLDSTWFGTAANLNNKALSLLIDA
jgi:phage/plasmid-like protein (TIGR03299 family)